MRSTFIVNFVLATSVLAIPQKRAVKWVTVEEVVTEVVWVTDHLDAPTATAPTATAPTATAPAVKQEATQLAVQTPAAVPSKVAPAKAPLVSIVNVIASSPATSAPAMTSSSSASGLGEFEQTCVDSHNGIRSQHRAGPLIWDADLAASAQALATTCDFGHNVDLGPASNYGQNIAASWGTLDMHNATVEAQTVITNSWYLAEGQDFAKLDLYGLADPTNDDFESWGHFTQEIWVATTKVGCAVQVCGPSSSTDSNHVSDGYYTVCNYDPAGNMEGEFAQNVLQ